MTTKQTGEPHVLAHAAQACEQLAQAHGLGGRIPWGAVIPLVLQLLEELLSATGQAQGQPPPPSP